MNETPVVLSSGLITQDRRVVVASPKAVATALLTNAAATLYTAPSTTTPVGSITRAKLKNILFCNTDSSARTVTIHLVASGGSASASNRILSAASIAASTTWIFELGDGVPLENGETIQGLASVTNVVTHRISLEEYL